MHSGERIIMSFDFYGIKSGMTFSELSKYLDYEEHPFFHHLYICDEENHKFLYKKEFNSLDLFFTDKKILWKLIVNFEIPDDPIQKSGLEKALREKYKEHSIKENYEYFCYQLIMIDNEIETKAIEKYKNSIMDKI